MCGRGVGVDTFMSDPGEPFDIVDENDVVIGQSPRGECHGNPALVHRAVHVIIVNDAGELLLQKRSIHKDIQPGKWDTSVGGHLEVGESYRSAAYREMAEELGLVDLPVTFLYYSQIRNQIESENVATFLARYSALVHYNPHEISEVRYWSAGAIDEALGKGVFTPNFEEEWAMYQAFCRRFSSGDISGPAFCAGDSFPDILRHWND